MVRVIRSRQEQPAKGLKIGLIFRKELVGFLFGKGHDFSPVYSLKGPGLNFPGFHCFDYFIFPVTYLPPKFSVSKSLAFAPVIPKSLQGPPGQVGYFFFRDVPWAHNFIASPKKNLLSNV
jgi:hypothetical protein